MRLLCRCCKAQPGRIFLLLSPAERAAMSSTNQPKSLGKASCSSMERSATSSGDLSEASTQAAWQPRADAAPGAGANAAPAGQQCYASDAEQASISTPFSSFCIDEENCDFSSLSLERSKALREQLKSMHTFASACMPETATTVPIIPLTNMALLEETFMQKSLSADTDSVPHVGGSLREQLRAALVPSLAASACSAVRSTSALNVAPGSDCGEAKASASQQDVPAWGGSIAAQPLESALRNAFSPAFAGLNPEHLEEVQADEQGAADDRLSLSCAALRQSQLGPEKTQISGDKGSADADARKTACPPSDLASSGPEGPRAAQRSSREELRQAQAALASFPGHMTESQATAVADVRSRMRGLAQESTAKTDRDASSASSAACGSAHPPPAQESACGMIQRLSVVVGDQQFRSASACPADYCTPAKLPFESASSLSLPDDTFRSVLDEVSGTVAAGSSARTSSPLGFVDRLVEDELVTYRRRRQDEDWDLPSNNKISKGQARAAQEKRASKEAPHLGSHQLPMRDSAFDSERSNSPAAAGHAEDPPLPRPSLSSKIQTSRQALLPLSFSWKPWVISAAIVASCSLLLPSAAILCVIAALLVSDVASWVASNLSNTILARLPISIQSRSSM